MSADTYAHLSAREAVMMGDAPDLPIVAELKRLRDENARLRELVRSVYKAFITLEIDQCQACPYDTVNTPCKQGCFIEKRMRELGIEVKE